jgi:4-hydroxyphenylpyruvate dioxygenase-like putative hemolysin
MKMLKVFFVVLLLCMTSNFALAGDQTDLSKQLMQTLGFDLMLESVRKDTVKMVEGQMDSIIGQMRNSFPNMPEATLKEFEAAAQAFGSRITDSWNSSEAAKIYSTSLVDGLPEKDMRAAIEHYKTPEGQRELKVINEAAKKMNGYIMRSIQKETDVAMKDFLREVKLISERARNRQSEAN